MICVKYELYCWGKKGFRGLKEWSVSFLCFFFYVYTCDPIGRVHGNTFLLTSVLAFNKMNDFKKYDKQWFDIKLYCTDVNYHKRK